MPLSSEAARFYKSGPPFLHDYFPFWMAALLGKLIILLIPILAVLYPMMRFLPGLYDWAMRSKVLRMYGELRLLEDEMANARDSGRDMRVVVAASGPQSDADHLKRNTQDARGLESNCSPLTNGMIGATDALSCQERERDRSLGHRRPWKTLSVMSECAPAWME